VLSAEVLIQNCYKSRLKWCKTSFQVLESSFVQGKLVSKSREFAEKPSADENQEMVIVSLHVFLSEIWFPVKEELLQVAMTIEDGTFVCWHKSVFLLVRLCGACCHNFVKYDIQFLNFLLEML